MAYDSFKVLRSSAVPLPIENVDTDQIIPARFLKATERKGFGDNLFRDWRYDKNDQPKSDFVLNNPTYLDLLHIADKEIETTQDLHHVYLEGVHVIKQVNNGLHQVELILGS